MRVIGTAGHVDHGKSTLVQALTGTHPDRLKEEREREMTIDLGFAWMTLPPSSDLPGGEEVGIVDVPGHRDFIENMLAGVGGIDAALFVVAADEGVMPQTREHLAILDILQIGAGVVALTKMDMVPDADWLELVSEDIRQVLGNTVLANAPIIPVSARTGHGIPQLKQALAACLAGRPPRQDLGRPRLPVDRVFTVAGFGTVVTGTLVDGSFQIGDELEILGAARQELRGRVRGLQSHKKKETQAVPGSRTAINISGVNVEDLQRGCVIAHPGDYTVSRRLDVRFRLLPDASQALEHNTTVKMFIGATERVARIRLLGVEKLLPAEESWLQLELDAPVVAVRGDRYILRRPSPGETLGGGIVVDHHPARRHKRFSQEVLERLEALTRGTPGEMLLQALNSVGAASLQEVIGRANLAEDAASAGIQELRQAGLLVAVETDLLDQAHEPGQPVARNVLVASRPYWNGQIERVVREVTAYHQQFPLRKGMPKEELKSRLKLAPRLYNQVLRWVTAQGRLRELGPLLLMPDFVIQFTPAQQRQVDALLQRFFASPYAPPTWKECVAEIGEDLVTALVDTGVLVHIPPDVLFRTPDYQAMVQSLREMISSSGPVTAAQVRDRFNTSRRYVLAFLEHLDAAGITVRAGDFRHLK
jgi:selenocysteine-specific elongation factor